MGPITADSLSMIYDAQTCHGYGGTHDEYGRDIDFSKSEVSDMILHNMLPILRYPCIIEYEELQCAYVFLRLKIYITLGLVVDVLR